MNDALMYFLKVNIAIALFYLFYRLFFAGDTFWKVRRYYLLSSVVVSFLYPFFSIESWMQKQEPIQRIIVDYTSLPEVTITPIHNPTLFTIENILMAIYALVVLVLVVRFLIQMISIFRIGQTGKRENIQGVEIVAVDKEISPFSFFRTIYMNPTLHNAQETSQILLHEQTHVRQWHSMDVIVSEMLTMAFWANPATWLLKREIRQNLEFLADNKVIESGFDSRTYQYHLLQLAYQAPNLKLTNKFNVSPLKKRITMMNQQKTSKARLLKYSLIVPLALALVLSSNAQTVVNKAKKVVETTQDTVVTKIKTAKSEAPKLTKTTVKFTAPVIKKDEGVRTGDDKIFEMVEKMPKYPGGESELMSFIAKNIKYPIVAQETGTQGTLIVRFVVNKEGKVINASILKSMLNAPTANKGVVVVGYARPDSIVKPSEQARIALENEALRVVNAMPQWTPGEQKGKKVAVYYTLPIKFKLE